jgi:hypothetical protein
MVWTGVLGCWKEPIASLETVPRFQSLGTVVDQITTTLLIAKIKMSFMAVIWISFVSFVRLREERSQIVSLLILN